MLSVFRFRCLATVKIKQVPDALVFTVVQNADSFRSGLTPQPTNMTKIDLTDSLEKIPVKIFPDSKTGSAFVAKEIAAIKNMAYDDVVAITNRNARQLFRMGEI